MAGAGMMQAAGERLGRVRAHMALGWRQGDMERLLIAALVALPFVGGLAILVGWIVWLPAAAMVAVAGAIQFGATLWLAGVMAREEDGAKDGEGG